MSRYTTPKRNHKRSHRSPESGGGDPINMEVSHLHSSVHSHLTEQTMDATGENGNKTVVIRSHPKGHFHKPGASIRDLMQNIFPILRFRYKRYGAYCTATAGFTGVASLQTQTYATEAVTATARNIIALSQKQTFITFQHLSNQNLRSYDTNEKSVQQLINIQLNSPVQQISTATVPSGNPLIDAQSKFKSFYYKGGGTEHMFMNTGNADVFLEFWEVRPKRFLLADETPGATLAVGKQMRGYGPSTLTSGNGATQFQPNNLDYTVENSDHLFHDKFFCSNKKYLKVLAGETVKVFVKHPPFSLTGQDTINSMINGNYIETITASTADMDYMPFCTVWLMMRMHGQMVTDDAGNGVVSKVAISTCEIAHMQREWHTAQGGFFNNPVQTIENDGWSDVLSSTSAYLQNPLTAAPELVSL